MIPSFFLATTLASLESQTPIPHPDPDPTTQSRQTSQTHEIAEGFVILAPEWEEDFATGVLTFRGGVTALYGPTKIESESLTVYRLEQRFETAGETRLTDPEGTIQASSISASYNPADRRATAQNATLSVGKVRLRAQTLEVLPVTPLEYRLTNVEVTLVDLDRSRTRFRAREVTVYPGRYAIARHVTYQVLGQNLPPIPVQRINLDRRVTGLKLPSITDRRGVGLGLSWDSAILLDDRTSVSAAYNAFPRQFPETLVQITHTPLKPSENNTGLAPRSDLGERAADSWFGNVTVPGLTASQTYRETRLAYSLSSTWNLPTVARPNNAEDVSKLAEIALESGGALGPVGARATIRAQRIRADRSQPWQNRLASDLVLVGPPAEILPGLELHTRIDLFTTLSPRGPFALLRTETGLVTRPVQGVTTGAAIVFGQNLGDPDFLFDPLNVTRALHLRADYRQGPWTFRYLAKYDFGRSLWYDKEWEIALVAGSFEPFLLRREEPTDFRFGVRFRLGSLAERLQDRNPRRTNPPNNP